MSIIVSVKINDGVVMASDSATTFYTQNGQPSQIYEHADKIVNLVKGLPIGVMTCGAGAIGEASIVTLLKDLRRLLDDSGTILPKVKLDKSKYTMEEAASQVHTFFSERAATAGFKGFLKLRICGYSADRPLPEVWEVNIQDNDYPDPVLIQPEHAMGPRWDGEYEALSRLIGGWGGRLVELATQEGVAIETCNKVLPQLYELLILPAAPIQDAIDLASFMVETTKGFTRFSVARTKTVGGPVEIAAITKHEGFKWVQRKLWFPASVNPS